MFLATAAGVLKLPDASALPAPPPPGVVVVPAPDPEALAAEIAGILAAGRCLSVDEAAAELGRRRAAALEGPAEVVRACGVRAAVATAAVERVKPGLSSVPSGLAGSTVRAAAHGVVEAGEALEAARDAVGSRPGYDDDAAVAARVAQTDVEQARADRNASLPRANRMLMRANAGAGLVVVGRMVSEAFDRAFILVALLPLVALGFAAYSVVEPARRSRAAARRRWSALRSMNVSTMAGLAALEERAAAWERRAARVRTAEADFRAARDTWRSLVGSAVALHSADRLAADLEAAGALELAAREADDAWTEAAAALQAAEDTTGAGQPALVVLDPDTEAEGDARHLAVGALAALAGATTVVVVVAQQAVAPEAVVGDGEPDPTSVTEDAEVFVPTPDYLPSVKAVAEVAAPKPAAAGVVGVVDLRERVKAGLLRLRSRSAPPQRPSATDAASEPAGDPVAAEG